MRFYRLIALITLCGCAAVPQSSPAQPTPFTSVRPPSPAQPYATSSPPPTTVAPTSSPSASVATTAPEADLTGRFYVNAEVHGCSSSLVDTDGKAWNLGWPEGYTVRADGNGSFELIDPEESPTARVGDFVGVNGSEEDFSTCMAGRSFAATQVVFVVRSGE